MTTQREYEEWRDTLVAHVGEYLERASAVPYLAEIMDVRLSTSRNIDEEGRRELISIFHLMAFLAEVRDIHDLMKKVKTVAQAEQKGGPNQ